MPLQHDPEFLQVIEPLIASLPKIPKLRLQDIQAGREGREAGLRAFQEKIPVSPDVEQTIYHVPAADGYQIPVYRFTKAGTGAKPGPAIVHYHGGGMVMGSAQLYARHLASLVSETSVPIFSVNYRLAPEYNGTTLVEDCYAAFIWLRHNADEQHVDPARIAVFGESAGGGLAAGVALMARDNELQPPLAKQILIYPMLDDRSSASEALDALAIWKTEDNRTAWTAVLGEKAGDPDADVSPYAAPARAVSLAGLPPAYIDIGTLDIFCDENVAYAARLLRENITTELHVYPGLPHGFVMIAPNISASKRAHDNRIKAMLSF